MYTISKKFTFEASHQLQGLPETHPCSNLHGHSYQVELFLSSDKLAPVGFVVDFRDLSEFKKYIDEKLDHTHLNSVFTFNPTSENIAKHLYIIAVQLFGEIVEKVQVKETDSSSACYCGRGV